MTECWAVVDGHKIRYLFGGSGPPLLLIHGLMGFSFSWSENLPELSQHFTVFAPDLLSVGYSERADVDASLAACAARVLRFMDSVGIAAATVIATSHGGSIAMAMGILAPERIQRWMLVAPSTPSSERSRTRIKLLSTWAGGKFALLMYAWPTLFNGLAIKYRMYGDASRALPGTVKEYSAPLKTPGTLEYLLKIVRCWFNDFEILERNLNKIAHIPTVLVWGTKDVVVPLKTAEPLKRHFQRAELVLMEGAGHLPYEEMPEQFNEIVVKHLCSSAAVSASPAPRR